jgi:hypothetical protein
LRTATVEEVRDALKQLTRGMAENSARQIVLRVTSLLSYGNRLGYLPFNAGATIREQSERDRGARLAKRIIGELDVRDMIRSAAPGATKSYCKCCTPAVCASARPPT